MFPLTPALWRWRGNRVGAIASAGFSEPRALVGVAPGITGQSESADGQVSQLRVPEHSPAKSPSRRASGPAPATRSPGEVHTHGQVAIAAVSVEAFGAQSELHQGHVRRVHAL